MGCGRGKTAFQRWFWRLPMDWVIILLRRVIRQGLYVCEYTMLFMGVGENVSTPRNSIQKSSILFPILYGRGVAFWHTISLSSTHKSSVSYNKVQKHIKNLIVKQWIKTQRSCFYEKLYLLNVSIFADIIFNREKNE